MKNIRIFIWKFSYFCGKIFSVFEIGMTAGNRILTDLPPHESVPTPLKVAECTSKGEHPTLKIWPTFSKGSAEKEIALHTSIRYFPLTEY